MQGGVENFFKVFDEAKRRFANINMSLTYTKFYRLLIEIDNKTVLDLKGNDSNILFGNAASILLDRIRS